MSLITRRKAIKVLETRKEWLTNKIAAHPDNTRVNAYFSEEVKALEKAIDSITKELAEAQCQIRG